LAPPPHGASTAAELIGDGLFPKLGHECVIGEPVDMFVEPISKAGFDDLDGLGVKLPTQPQ